MLLAGCNIYQYIFQSKRSKTEKSGIAQQRPLSLDKQATISWITALPSLSLVKGLEGKRMEKLDPVHVCVYSVQLWVRLWGETQAWSKCHQRTSLKQLERLRVVIFILWALTGRWTGRENICNFMVSSGEIWFQMAGSLINRNCCLQSFPKGIEEMVQVSLTSESVWVLNVCLCTYLCEKCHTCPSVRSGKGTLLHVIAVVFAQKSSIEWTSLWLTGLVLVTLYAALLFNSTVPWLALHWHLFQS